MSTLSRLAFSPVVCLAASSVLLAGAQRTATSFEVIVESPTTIESTLRDLVRRGHTCAAVARPFGARLATNIAVIMGRPGAGATDVAVATATAEGLADLERRLNDAAQQGFRLCGLTITAAIWGRPSAYAVVAVLDRSGTAATGTAYRVIRSRGRREDWTLLERAAADGFEVSQLVSRPNPEPGAGGTSEMVFVAARTGQTRPVKYELVFAGNGPALEKEIEKSTKRGYCIHTAWATEERLTVMLAQPLAAACHRPHEYEVEESSSFTVSGTDGLLLGIFRMKNGTMAVHDGRDSSVEYSVVEAVLPDLESRPVRRPREIETLVDKLNVEGGRGYQPLDVTWRDAGSGLRAIDIVLSRPRR